MASQSQQSVDVHRDERPDPELDRTGRRMRKSGWPFLLIAALVAAPGALLILLGDGWMDPVGIAFVTLALVPAMAAIGLLVSGVVSWWAARDKPFV